MFKFLSKLLKSKSKHKQPNFKIVKTKEDIYKEKVLREFVEKV
jgi:hypothetical protein